ncbi:hypothetical protein [Halobacteriovorax sp. HLS]|uniref:hypothetical protein n=1 Tax=Halobacteriovorax sp. HLS TaxID=2234000 RepID=UPI000FD8B3BD|nr:hypothetical protein [Halobacteriovorax sp. HLS]
MFGKIMFTLLFSLSFTTYSSELNELLKRKQLLEAKIEVIRESELSAQFEYSFRKSIFSHSDHQLRFFDEKLNQMNKEFLDFAQSKLADNQAGYTSTTEDLADNVKEKQIVSSFLESIVKKVDANYAELVLIEKQKDVHHIEISNFLSSHSQHRIERELLIKNIRLYNASQLDLISKIPRHEEELLRWTYSLANLDALSDVLRQRVVTLENILFFRGKDKEFFLNYGILLESFKKDLTEFRSSQHLSSHSRQFANALIDLCLNEQEFSNISSEAKEGLHIVATNDYNQTRMDRSSIVKEMDTIIAKVESDKRKVNNFYRRLITWEKVKMNLKSDLSSLDKKLSKTYPGYSQLVAPLGPLLEREESIVGELSILKVERSRAKQQLKDLGLSFVKLKRYQDNHLFLTRTLSPLVDMIVKDEAELDRIYNYHSDELPKFEKLKEDSHREFVDLSETRFSYERELAEVNRLIDIIRGLN